MRQKVSEIEKMYEISLMEKKQQSHITDFFKLKYFFQFKSSFYSKRSFFSPSPLSLSFK